jgi:hypothetical protein
MGAEPAIAQPAAGAAARAGRVDYREVLSPPEFAVYDRLRTLRKELAQAEGLPPYAVFSNEQLAAFVQRRNQQRAGAGRGGGCRRGPAAALRQRVRGAAAAGCARAAAARRTAGRSTSRRRAMTHTVRIELADVAAWPNLEAALCAAARGKRTRPDVASFIADAPRRLAQVRHALLQGRLPDGRLRAFRDPRPEAAADPRRAVRRPGGRSTR